MGQFEAAQGAELLVSDESITIWSPPLPGTLAAWAPFNPTPVSAPNIQLRISAQVKQGALQLGIIGGDNGALVASTSLGPSKNPIELIFVVPPDVSAKAFVVRNAAENGASVGTISGVALVPESSLEGDEQQVTEKKRGVSRTRPLIAGEMAQYWFVQYLKAAIPVLSDSNTSDWEKVNAVREWAYRSIPRSAGSAALLQSVYGYGEAYPLQAYRGYYLTQTLAGGFYCGGTASLLEKAFVALGYHAASINSGSVLPNNLTHVLTVVEIEHEGQPILSIQDAYFNYTIVNRGKPADFRDLLGALGRGDASAFEIKSGAADCKLVLPEPDAFDETRSYHGRFYTLGPVTEIDKIKTYCHNFSLDTWEDRGKLGDWLEAETGRRGFLYILLFPLGTSGQAWANELIALADAARSKLLSSREQSNVQSAIH